ncbi:MAG: arylsulfatase [Flavobacteriaceae bacterium]
MRYRSTKKTAIFIIFLCFTVFTSCSSETEKPNVILILVDDQGYGDIASLGNPYIKTPNIDSLHAQSTRFTDYHVSPTCAPTRAALMTGHHNYRTGVFFTIKGRSLILEKETTMAQIFKENGYSTAIFGKWHLGDNYPFRPEDKGFDEVLIHPGGGMGQTMDYWDNDYFDDMYKHNGELKKFEGYCTDVWFENATKFIESKKEEPFFCYLATNAAHSPYHVEDSYANPYKNNENIPNANFYGMLANIDENIGKLIAYLDSSGLRDNTILIFTTDNGTAAGAKLSGDRLDGFVAKGNNDGMRGVKASMYDGGHRVPLFIHWKDGKINVGRDVDQLTAHYDVLPTLVDMCNLKVDPKITFDGKSLVPLMQGDTKDFEDRMVFVSTQFSTDPVPWKRTALLHKNWRLVQENELYNLETDPEQRTNLAEEFPERVEEYKAAYTDWWNQISPTFSEKPYFIIGDKAENPTTLFCHDWHSEQFTPWHQRHIRTGYVNNGYWRVRVAEEGTYNLKLRRWPEESGLSLGAEAPVRPAIPGTSVSESKKGKALSIEQAKIEIQDISLTKNVDLNKEYIEFTVELKKGDAHLQTWFALKNSEEIGAYFVTMERLN